MTAGSNGQQVHLRIVGMTCGACVQRVQRALQETGGVQSAVVNLMNESATLTAVADGEIGRRAVDSVRAAGYDAEVVPSGAALVGRLSDDSELRQQLRRHRQDLVQVLMTAIPIVVLEHVRHVLWLEDAGSQIAARLMQFALFVFLTLTSAGQQILVGGLRALLHRTGTMDLLISLAVTVAFVSSLYGVFVARDDAFVHLEAAAMILGVVCVGRYLETRARGRAAAITAALARRAPKTARVQRDGAFVSVPADEVRVGDVVSVSAGETVPVDGKIVQGRADIDESLMTGEPVPVERGVGDLVRGGTVVASGDIVMETTAIGVQAALGRIMQLVARAQSGRTAMQRIADRIAAVFTPVVVCVAVVVFAAWCIWGGASGVAMGARSAVAVLVVACPCALGLATPVVVMVSSGLAGLRGILVRDAPMLEAMGQIDTVVWDKTGTTTTGVPAVRRLVTAEDADAGEVMRLAAAAEQFSSHPLGEAIVAYARREQVALPMPEGFEHVAGGGVDATVEGRSVLVGRAGFLRERGADVAALDGLLLEAREPAATIVAVAVDGCLRGAFFLDDTIRPSAANAVRRLRNLGIRSHLLTGDRGGAAEHVAQQVGIDDVRAEADPADKVTYVEDLRQGGRRVAMVGDGVNDAGALAAADVGIAFATGAEVAGEAAGISLVGSTPHLVADAVELARAAVRLIRQNLFWAFIYNVLMIPLAGLGILPPAVAAGAMMLSSITVVLNALRLPRVVGWRSGAAT